MVGFILSAAAPLMVAAGVVTTAFAVTGLRGIPAAFAVVAVVLAVFCVGFVAMARRITNAGAFYAYAAQGIGRPVGVGAAMVAVVSYVLLQVGLLGAFGPIFGGYLEAKTGVQAPWWLWALAAWGVTAVVGQLWVDLNGKVLAVAVAAEVAVVAILAIAGAANPAPGGGVGLGGLSPDVIGQPGAGAALVIALLGFVGLEGSAVYSEESKDPRRTVAVATFGTLAVMAVLYVGASWALAAHYGAGNVSTVAGQLGPEALFGMGPAWAAEAGRMLFITSVLASLLSFHNAVARYLFALGRERLLPRIFARTNRRTGAPAIASLAQSVIGLAVIVVYAVAGWDPMVQLFFWLGTTGGFGVLLLFTLTSASVLGFFTRNRRGESVWRRRIAPMLSLAALAAMTWQAVANYSTLLGVAPDATVAWLLPGAYPAAFAVGLVYGWWLRVRRPATYAGIGLGANAATGRSSVAEPGAVAPGYPSAPVGQGGLWQ
jgi:amino acid transporter